MSPGPIYPLIFPQIRFGFWGWALLFPLPGPFSLVAVGREGESQPPLWPRGRNTKAVLKMEGGDASKRSFGGVAAGLGDQDGDKGRGEYKQREEKGLHSFRLVNWVD